MKNLPNVIVNGVAKSGTSSFYNYLNAHKDIFMPARKEMNFFSYYQNESASYKSNIPQITDLQEYQSYFEKGESFKIRGDVSPSYFSHLGTAARIKAVVPSVKFIMTLRNPVDRAYSGYLMQVRGRGVDPELQDPFSEDQHWVRLGLYHDHVKEYYDHFERDQILTVLLEDIRDQREQILKNVFAFLELEYEDYQYDQTKVHNSGFIPKYPLLNKLGRKNSFINNYIKPRLPKSVKNVARKIENMNKAKPQPMLEETRDRLNLFYKDDILKLEELIGKDLSRWYA